MNGTFEIKSETKSYEYKNSQLFVQGNYAKEMQGGNIQRIDGQCYRILQDGTQGAYVGNFTGIPSQSGEILYSMSSMSRQDSNKVWDAIDEIEAHILGENE